MKLISSKLTKKYQATIPAPVREFIKLEAGDILLFEIKNEEVVLKKGNSIDIAFTKSLEGTLNEWLSEEDDNAYNNL